MNNQFEMKNRCGTCGPADSEGYRTLGCELLHLKLLRFVGELLDIGELYPDIPNNKRIDLVNDSRKNAINTFAVIRAQIGCTLSTEQIDENISFSLLAEPNQDLKDEKG